MRSIVKQFIVIGLFFGGCVVYPSLYYKVHLSSSWYPSKRHALLNDLAKRHDFAVKHYGSNLQPGLIRALICPHAGYEYSGNIAAAGYHLIKPGTFKRVIILAPTHYAKFSGLALPNKQYQWYKNVLGSLDLDTSMLHELGEQSSLVSYQSKAHEVEHAIITQLPFIQKYCGESCKIVPLLVGNISVDQAEKIASMIKPYLDDETLVVVSTDLTHHGSRFNYTPFDADITQQIFELDSNIVKEVQEHDLKGFDAIMKETEATICGKYPIMVLLALLQQKAFGDVDSYVVAYDTSASDQKNPDHSVSYLSLVISNEKREQLSFEDQLTDYEKSLLLKLARRRLQEVVQQKKDGNALDEVIVPGLLSDALRKVQGVFVTLYEIAHDGSKKLRGCIGNIIGKTPLYQTVYNMTKSAALHDSRFSPVRAEEVPNIEISISALTPPQQIASYRDIVLGQDGMILKKDGRSAVYLPKVATEQGWNLSQALSSLSQKAGLTKNTWQDPQTQFQTFQSIDFSEPKK